MAHGLFSLQFSRFSFALGRAASAKLLKKLQFPSFQWVSLTFSSFSLLWGAQSGKTAEQVVISKLCTAGKPHFYDFIALRGPRPVSFVHCPKFPAEFEHVTT
jgi:hypothetical protein